MKQAIARPPSQSDGRNQRTERSREKIIQALISLCSTGNLQPTAQQVAEAAGVGIRTVFRLFSEKESLFTTLDERLFEEHRPLFAGGNRSGSLAQRVERMVTRRANAYEIAAPFIRSTLSQLWSSEQLQIAYARQVRRLRKDLHEWIPELETAPRELQEAAEVANSFECWNRLRRHQGLNKSAAIKTVIYLTLPLFDHIKPGS